MTNLQEHDYWAGPRDAGSGKEALAPLQLYLIDARSHAGATAAQKPDKLFCSGDEFVVVFLALKTDANRNADI